MVFGRAFLEEPDRRVDGHALPHLTEQRANGLRSRFALQIPQRDLDRAARLGRDPLVAQPATSPQAQALGVEVDRTELLADQQRRERVVDHGGQHSRVRAAVTVATLAVADETGVGLDAHEEERHRLSIEFERDGDRRDVSYLQVCCAVDVTVCHRR